MNGTNNLYLSKLELNARSQKTAKWLYDPYKVHCDLWKAFPNKSSKEEPAPFLYRLELNHQQYSFAPRILVQSKIKPKWDETFSNLPVLLNEPEIKDKINPDTFVKEDTIFRFSLVANPTQKIIDYRKLFEKELSDYPKEYSRLKHKEYLEGREKLEKLVNTLSQEQKNSFRLEARGKQLTNMKRVGIYSEQEQIEWLKRQGNNPKFPNRGGFEILQVEVKDEKGNIGYWDSAISYNQDIIVFQKEKENVSHKIKMHTVSFSGVLRVTDKEAFKLTYSNGIGSAKAFGCGMLLLARL